MGTGKVTRLAQSAKQSQPRRHRSPAQGTVITVRGSNHAWFEHGTVTSPGCPYLAEIWHFPFESTGKEAGCSEAQLWPMVQNQKYGWPIKPEMRLATSDGLYDKSLMTKLLLKIPNKVNIYYYRKRVPWLTR